MLELITKKTLKNIEGEIISTGYGIYKLSENLWHTPDHGLVNDIDMNYTLEPAKRKKVSRVEFKMLFLLSERVAIANIRKYDGTDPQLQQMKIALDSYYEILEDPSLQEINLENPIILEGITMLEVAGIISEARKNEILEGYPEE